MTAPTLSIVVPVFNEKHFVEDSLRRLHSTPMGGVSRREIIVIDDCSKDGTSEILKKLQPELGFRLEIHSTNRGKGGALRTGISLATGDLVVFHDADLEYDPVDINRLLGPFLLDRADVVYGSRFIGSEMRRCLFFWHQVGNRAISLFVNMVSNLNFTDVETCYKMFRRSDLLEMNLTSERFGIEIEMTIKAAKKRLRVYEVPISYSGRTYEQGKKITWKDGVSALYHIIKFSTWG